jgi:hypothetical protein
MTEKLKQPLVLVGLAILLISVIAIVTSWNGYDSDKTDGGIKVDPAQLPASDLNTVIKSPGNTGVINDTSKGNVSRAVTKEAGNTAADKVPRHQDMLSEEMKQGIRDQLFQHGEKRTITKPDGTVIMPSDGRFTQVPVAVEMPDGTIQIKEYSELPE